jgi:translation initiation factor 4G
MHILFTFYHVHIQSVLNKLTPEKFDVLVAKVKEIGINTLELLRSSVLAVFEKALAEPVFSPVYAEFCVKVII